MIMDLEDFVLNLFEKYGSEADELFTTKISSLATRMISEAKWVGVTKIEGYTLYMMVRYFKPEIVMEGGSGHGYSAQWILHALQRNGKGRFYGFEIQPSIYYAREISKEFGDIATFIEGDCTPSLSCAYGMVVGKRYEDLQEYEKNTMEKTLKKVGHVDFLFMDGYHNYEFGKWWTTKITPYLSKGGLIGCHDIQNLGKPNPNGDEWVAVKEFADANPQFKVLQMSQLASSPKLAKINQEYPGLNLHGIVFLSERF